MLVLQKHWSLLRLVNGYKVFEKHWQQGSTEERQKEILISSGANEVEPEKEHQKGRNILAHSIVEQNFFIEYDEILSD